jgi:cytochrome P450
MNLLDGTDIFSWRGVSFIVLAFLSFNVLKLLFTAIYNLYFHPLHKFPGPKLWIAFPILRNLDMVSGNLDYTMKDLHDKYGDVVRFNPNDLSFISAAAWKDIYGFGHAEMPKHFPHFVGFDGQNILSAKGPDHFRFRRAMLPAFTDKSLALQEPIIGGYVDLLVKRLREIADSGPSTNMVRWYNYTTFDLIGDLAYGESFKGLEEGKSNNWLDNISNLLKLMPILALMSVSPTLGRILQLLAGSKIRNAQKAHLDNSAALAMRRISRTDQKDRGDFMDAMMRAKGQKHELTDDELIANADILITAGSETTATLLSGVTYWLLRTPGAFKKVTEEVRSAFEKEEDITFKEASSRLPYMLACLHEGLRIFPPIPLILLRQTNPGPPVSIAGYTVPPNVHVPSRPFMSHSTNKLPRQK